MIVCALVWLQCVDASINLLVIAQANFIVYQPHKDTKVYPSIQFI